MKRDGLLNALAHNLRVRCSGSKLRPEWLLAGGTFCLFWLVSTGYTGPAYLSDEVGYLGHAALLAGYTIDAASKWHAGYSLLLAPLFRILSGPEQVWQGVMLVNAAMWAASFLLLSYMLSRFFPDCTGRRRLAAVAVAAICPTWLTMSGYAFATPAIVLVFMISVITALNIDLQHPRSIIPHSLAVGFLYWVHPTGLAVVVASTLTLTFVSFRKRQCVSLAIHIILVSVLLVVYREGLHQWLLTVGTSPGFDAGEGYPEYALVFSQLFSARFWLDTVIAALGQVSYLVVGSFGLACVGFLESVRRARALFTREDSKDSRREEAIAYASLFALLSMAGVILVGSASFSAVVAPAGGIMSRPDQWIYGRYAEGVLLPFLAFGWLATFRRRWIPVLAGGLVASGVLLALFATPFGHNNIINTTALWPQYLFKTPHFLLWMAVGAIGVFVFQIARQEGRIGRSAALVLLVGAYALSDVNAAQFHHGWLDGYSKPTAVVEIIRTNFEPGSCVAFNPDMPAAAPYFERQRYPLHLFYLYDYAYHRMSVSDWLSTCDGPLLTYEIGQVVGKPGVVLLGREVRSGLYLVAKDRDEGFQIPSEPPTERTFYLADGWAIDGDIDRYGEELAALPSEVGEFRDGMIVSTGQPGLLVCGPGVHLDQGKYRVVVVGSAPMVSTAWVEVVSESGRVRHTEFEFSRTQWDETGIVASGYLFLNEQVDDLEVRVHVGPDDVVRLEGYELVPIDALPVPSI